MPPSSAELAYRMSNESKRMSISNEFLEADVNYFKVPLRNLRGGTEENQLR
jgi:hypothetical protein